MVPIVGSVMAKRGLRYPWSRFTADTYVKVGSLKEAYFIEYWNKHRTETFVRWFQKRSAWKCDLAVLRNFGLLKIAGKVRCKKYTA